MDISKAIDKAAGEIRPRVPGGQGGANAILGTRKCGEAISGEAISGEAISGEAQQWSGWGTALKPAHEPAVLARKPFKGTVAANVLKHGTGGINVDGCRVATDERIAAHYGTGGGAGHTTGKFNTLYQKGEASTENTHTLGRWPANLIHDGSDDVVALFPQSVDGVAVGGKGKAASIYGTTLDRTGGGDQGYGGSGSAARFFYTAKAGKAERGKGNNHPTVKPLDLMAYLCRLVTPPGGTVLDPFMGSGTTIKAALSEGFNAVGIELDPAYFEIVRNRLDGAQIGLGIR
jgi:hypothetical protein